MERTRGRPRRRHSALASTRSLRFSLVSASPRVSPRLSAVAGVGWHKPASCAHVVRSGPAGRALADLRPAGEGRVVLVDPRWDVYFVALYAEDANLSVVR